MSDDKQTRLAVGDEVWLLFGTLLYDAVITQVRVNLEGDPAEFTMYRVESREHSKYFEHHTHHRSDLFRKSDERPKLIAEIEARIESLEHLRDEVEAVEEVQP